MTQCAVEERLNLRLAIQGLVTYAETLSVYGTDAAFDDGDDTPWSKAFLASAYASRGVKVRFTSGTGSEALMGHSEGCSMLALEARCLSLVRACGSQGVQNGAISCVALTMSLPGGTRAILAENLIAAWLDLEVASGNDAIASHSPTRRTAKLMGQFLPGTDFVTSGYSVMPRHDNTFGGGNYDADDLDEWMTLQRDWQVDAGIEPAGEDAVLAVRERAARAIQAVFDELGFPPVTDEEVEAATIGHSSHDMPDRDRGEDVLAADRVLAERITAADVALALDRRGFSEVAERVVGMQRQRISSDYLQTSAVIDADGRGALGGQRPQRLSRPGHRLPPRRRPLGAAAGAAARGRPGGRGPGRRGRRPGAAARPRRLAARRRGRRGRRRRRAGLRRKRCARRSAASRTRRCCASSARASRRRACSFRIVRIGRTSDVAFIAHDGAQLAGSGIAIGLQSKGTAVIHRADLQPLDNLELFGMAPLLRPDSYRQIGRNAARYANGGRASPVPLVLDNFARAKLIVRTALLHRRETEAIEPGVPAVDVTVVR